jgi:hypothetical protein
LFTSKFESSTDVNVLGMLLSISWQKLNGVLIGALQIGLLSGDRISEVQLWNLFMVSHVFTDGQHQFCIWKQQVLALL